MTPRSGGSPAACAPPGQGPDRGDVLPRRLEAAALLCILAVTAARPFASEMSFRTSTPVVADPARDTLHKPPEELCRVTFAVLLLGAGALWAAGQVLRRRAVLRGVTFAALLAGFAAWSFLSAGEGIDARGARTGWIEQVAILAAGVVVCNLAGDRRRRGMVIVVLAALGGTMALKAVTEVFLEVPDRIAQFEADPAGQLAMAGLTPDSPEARMFERRLRDRSCFGYLALANVFVSLLVVTVMAAGGLAAEKLLAGLKARRSRPPRRGPPRRGEINLHLLAGGVGLALTVLAGVAAVLTRSKGGIVAGALAVAAAAVCAWRRDFCARHRRKLLAAAGGGALAAIAAVVAIGIVRGGLPGRSMQVRWEYWAGSAGIVREAPLLGVGAGNFAHAYLRHRLPAAAESTKSAHNLLMDAACAYGLPGAAIYLAMLTWVLIALTSPSPPRGADPPAGAPSARAGPLARAATVALLAGAVLTVRAVWIAHSGAALLFIEAFLPACVFAVVLLAAMWAGDGLDAEALCGTPARIALGCGLAAFVLHNLVTYTLWTPATATVFWVGAGACVGAGAPGRVVPRKAMPVLAAVAVCAVAAAAWWLWRPVRQRTRCMRQAAIAFVNARPRTVEARLKQALNADPLDAYPAAELARLYAAEDSGEPTGPTGASSPRAAAAAEIAWRRSPTADNAMLLARALLPDPATRERALAMALKAVALDPMNVRRRITCARMLLLGARADQAAEQVRQVRRIDALRPPESDLRLTPRELAKLDAFP